MALRKTAIQKFETKLNNLLKDENISLLNNKVKARGRLIFEFNNKEIRYRRLRYYPTKKIELSEEDYEVVIPLNNENLEILSSNLINPSKSAQSVMDFFKRNINENLKIIEIGSAKNSINNSKVCITKNLYDLILKIFKEENSDKKIRISSRLSPMLKSNFGINIKTDDFERDYSLLLNEVLQSGQFSQNDLLPLIEELETGDSNNIVIEK